ncbi:C2 domain [Dillenia turbinata]|uniref:C2 domain n=1 Tax=Dillenia turbinata TaxID=194707 RepID=A0AAN8ZMM9_9MAGN
MARVRIVEITVINAKNLKAVRKESKMKVYAKISINGKPKTEKKTPVDKKGKRGPTWNFPVKYSLGERAVTAYGVMLQIELYCKRTCWKDKYIGEVSVPMKDLFARSNGNSGGGIVSYEVTRGSHKSQGEVTFSCAFSDVKTTKKWKKWLSGALNIATQVIVFY